VSKEKVVCETPTPNKKPTKIDQWKYEIVRSAILKSIPRKGDGLLFKNLPEEVAKKLSNHDKERLGSVGWYTTVVKLDMEVKKEIKRIEGVSPQRLIRY